MYINDNSWNIANGWGSHESLTFEVFKRLNNKLKCCSLLDILLLIYNLIFYQKREI